VCDRGQRFGQTSGPDRLILQRAVVVVGPSSADATAERLLPILAILHTRGLYQLIH